MGLLSHKDQSAGKQEADRTKPHAYKAPKLPPSSGHTACQICQNGPNDTLHGVTKSAAEEEYHWS